MLDFLGMELQGRLLTHDSSGKSFGRAQSYELESMGLGGIVGNVGAGF